MLEITRARLCKRHEQKEHNGLHGHFVCVLRAQTSVLSTCKVGHQEAWLTLAMVEPSLRYIWPSRKLWITRDAA